MKISAKVNYAINALVYIGLNNNKKTTIKEISQEEGISSRYLEQIFTSLKKTGIVESTKGSKGGYTLLKSPKEITILEIYSALEGESILENTIDIDNKKSNNIEYVINHSIWKKLKNTIAMFLGDLTLDDIISEYNGMNGDMYYI